MLAIVVSAPAAQAAVTLAAAADRLSHSRRLQGESSHSYEINEPVPLWANKVGPFSNPR